VPDVLVNYENISPSGKPLKSSAIGIRNEKGQIIGALGINMDTSYFGEFSNFIESFITPKKSKHILEHEKFYYVKASDEVRSTLKKVLIENGWHSQRLSPEQKSKLMRTLHEKGVFNMRGSVATVAAELNLTRPSIYKYIRQVAPPK
jgi:predicted transcriptional regulator YheO